MEMILGTGSVCSALPLTSEKRNLATTGDPEERWGGRSKKPWVTLAYVEFTDTVSKGGAPHSKA